MVVADLVLASARAWPDQGIRAQVALDVGGNDFSRNAIAGHKPLICTRHGWRSGSVLEGVNKQERPGGSEGRSRS